MPEDTKNKHIKQLRNSKEFIQSTTEPRNLRSQVEYLKKCVQVIMDSYTGDIQRTAEITMEKIEKFKLYDVTRFELCRWIQTLIYEINQT